MRTLSNRTLRVAAFGLALVACNSDRILAPAPSPIGPAALDIAPLAAPPSVRFSELHYDNAGTDAGEAIEISGPAGTSVAGWRIFLYNGANGAVYTPTITLNGTIPATCGGRGVIVTNYPVNGVQNGNPDAIALVDNNNVVIELLSYGGTFTAVGGPAAGMVTTSIGVQESGTTPVGHSLGRNGDGTWNAAAANTFGACNDNSSPAPVVDHITVAPSSASITQGGTQQFTATAFDAANQPVAASFTWTSSLTSVATVNASGLATGTGGGDTQITATSGSVSGSASLHVDAAVIASIVVTPATATIVIGGTKQFSATAFDAGSQPIANVTFTWASSATGVATVNASGLATGTGAGDAQITATSGTTTGTADLHVDTPTPVVVPDTRFSEIHYDNTGTDASEALEVEGPLGATLTGWSIVLYNGDPASGSTPLKVYHTAAVNGTFAAPIACGTRGVISIPIPAVPGIQNGGQGGIQPDGFALVDNNGQLIEFLSYEGSFTAADGPAAGVTSTDIGVMEDNPVPAPDRSLHRSADGATWSAASAADFGYVNACGGPPPSSITFSGRSPTADPPLPVGFEAQVFATETVGGSPVSTTFTWTSETPAIASIDQNGVFRALTAGTAVLRATATDGATATYSLPTIVGTQSSAPYGGNTEFGDPVDGDASNDYIIRRLEFTSSWNGALGRPNWVSQKLDATTYGSEDRCNCFTFDPLLEAAGFPRYTTADYTGAGSFAGYGIDRGHMTRSADRTASNLDNARTYYFSNIIPQAAANNQVTWKLLEDTLGTIAQNQGKAVYVVEGGSSSAAFPSKGFIKGQNKVEMPGAVWKVAVIMDHGKGLNDVTSVNDLTIIAIITPNDPNVNPDWHVYKTTVDAVEALSGYDLLSLLQDNIETAVESNDRPPVAAISGATSGNEGALLSFSASGSTDPDVGDVLSYSWTFGDGTTGTGVSPSHAFPDNGTFAVTVTVTDSHGVTDTASMNVVVANVAPSIASFTAAASPASVGSTVTATVNFTDPGAGDTHSAVINWGDGTTSTVSASSATQATATHVYANAGFYALGATLTDDDLASASSSTSLVVYNAAAGYLTGNGYVLKTLLGARTNFTLDVRYVGSNTTPTGSFQILPGSPFVLALTSNALQYMVVSANTGNVRGTGTLSDGTTVGFMVSGLDLKTGGAASDKIRIKVWRLAGGAVVYDTEPGVAESAAPATLVRAGSFTVRH